MRHLYVALLFAAAVLAQQPEFRTGHWRGRTLTYQVVNGWAIAQGDIILGRAGELANTVEAPEISGATPSFQTRGSGRSAIQYRWPDRIIPYVIDAEVPNSKRVTDAIAHWNETTPIRLVARTDEKNYVRFMRDNTNPGVCTSAL